MGKAIKLLRTPGFYNYTLMIREMLQIQKETIPSSMIPQFLFIASSESEETIRNQCGINWVSKRKK
jgi:hypothetical protein